MKKNNQQAFTLMELIVTLGIAGIVMAFAIPGMNQYLQNERLTSFTNTLLTDLMLARSRAVERNQPTIFCASNNETTCTGGSFKDGWIVAIDANNNGAVDNGELIKVQQEIEGNINFSTTVGASVLFDSRGFTPNTTGSITIDDGRGAEHRKTLNINRTGRVSR